MATELGHVHIETRRRSAEGRQFYIDNFGATVKKCCQLDLHGVQLNVTTINPDQNHQQHVGIEHIAIETDDMPAPSGTSPKTRRCSKSASKMVRTFAGSRTDSQLIEKV